MAETSKIEWTDATFNPWVGCTKISPACDHCYAEGWAKRAGNPELWQGERRRTSAVNWRMPVKLNALAVTEGRRLRVFCASLADVFDNQVPADWREDLWALIRATPMLDWQLLTKRPQNIGKMLPADWGQGWPNVWLGTTVENQAEADRRIPHLLATPAAVRFLSCEPLLGPVDLRHMDQDIFDAVGDALTGKWRWRDGPTRQETPRINWVIAGGESGPGARPMHPDWARSLRDQCAAAGVAFHFKQWGEWLSGEIFHPESKRSAGLVHWQDGQEEYNGEHIDFTTTVIGNHTPDGCATAAFVAKQAAEQSWIDGGAALKASADCRRAACRVAGHCKGDDQPWLTVARKRGKARAGRLLDGRTHDEFPPGQPAPAPITAEEVPY